jgi:hypothetical protein
MAQAVRLRILGLTPGRGNRFFLFSKTPRLALRPTRPSVQRAVSCPVCESVRSPNRPPIADLKNEWSYTFNPLHAFTVYTGSTLSYLAISKTTEPIYDFVWCRWSHGPRRDEVTGEWRKLHHEDLHDLYSSPTILRVIKSRRMRWAGHVARMREGWGVYRVLVGKPEEKRPLERPRCRWEDRLVSRLRSYHPVCT